MKPSIVAADGWESVRHGHGLGQPIGCFENEIQQSFQLTFQIAYRPTQVLDFH